MNAIEALYWSYFTFYRSVMKDDEPHLLTTLALSMSEAMLIIAVWDYTKATLLCKAIGKPTMFTILGLMLLLNYWYFHRQSRALKVVEQTPINPRLVRIVGLLFFSLTLLAFIDIPGTIPNILKRCE